MARTYTLQSAPFQAEMHRLSPVLYLTPQLTRTIRFPRNYASGSAALGALRFDYYCERYVHMQVITNTYWNETIKHTVWDAGLTFMARRPEIPAKFGNWGLILRLNVSGSAATTHHLLMIG